MENNQKGAQPKLKYLTFLPCPKAFFWSWLNSNSLGAFNLFAEEGGSLEIQFLDPFANSFQPIKAHPEGRECT